jgi:pectate lyase
MDHPLFPLTAFTGTPAFPGAEGFGAFTPGGRGGRILYVDNLNDAGPGSLRAAIEAGGPRIVQFRVGGPIELKSPIVIRQPFLTVDGQGAPGAGITLRRHGLEVRTHDVVLRHFRIRIGDDADLRGEYALYIIEGSHDVIADHLSLSWSTDKMLSTTKMSDRITIQYCILSESLNFSGHGYASIAGGDRVTWHHNLFAHHFNRSVRFQGMVDADFRNNVIYDWGEGSGYGEFDRLNYVGNYLQAGPSTTQKPLLFHSGAAVIAPGSLFVADNILEGDEAVNEDNWRGMGFYYFDRRSLAAPGPFAAPAVTTQPARTAYETVLNEAGATLPRRDAVDERIVH